MLPFGVHLISVDESSKVKIWDIKDESIYLELTFDKNTFNITTLMHPTTYINKVLFGSEQGQMQLWNLSKANLIYTFKGRKFILLFTKFIHITVFFRMECCY